LKQSPCRYFALDGGSGAHLCAALAGRHPYVQPVASPRHADLLVIVEPVSQKLAPALVELARSFPHPARALLISTPGTELDHFTSTTQADVTKLLPGIQRTPLTSIEALLEMMLDFEQWPELEVPDVAAYEPSLIQLPQKHEQELATELAVLSLGPVQPFTAGPLRLLLICDGEQVFSAQVESGYAHRGIARAMTQVDWQQGIDFARRLDPLAPIASQLAYVRATEQLQGWQPSTQTVMFREVALALERAQNLLWWLVRFMRLLADSQLTDRSHQLATALADCTSQLWQEAPSSWILAQQHVASTVVRRSIAARKHLQEMGDHVEILSRSIERNRPLALRTRGVGVLARERLVTAGVSGPVLTASEQGAGDVHSRLVARLHEAISDVREAVQALDAEETALPSIAHQSAPAGEASATVKGPRGDIAVRLVNSGGETLAQVEWQRPSAALLPLLPEMLAGQKLADAEVIVASLDLAMAEADG
jgi:NADH:ubiquinone oxidoreductase subunit D